jgi:Phage integrase family
MAHGQGGRDSQALIIRYRALVLVGAYGGLRIGELAGLRRSRVDLLRGTVQVAEIVVEVRGVLHVGPPKTRASRRTVGLPRFVVEELAAHLAGSGDPEGFVFTAPEGGPLRVNVFRARVWRRAIKAAGLDGLRIHDLRHTAVALWIAAGRIPRGVRPGRALLGELHPGPLWPPVSRGGRCPPRPPGRALRECPAGAGELGRAVASSARPWPQRGPRCLQQREERRRWDSDDALSCCFAWWARQGLNL